ncbi:MAG: hypothetical protein CSH37_09045 [Thalassolituus sp.]|jgi:hypothetical protein|nr:MAG: hypothetical protein CSH37_09045 [Thalassolituus sp.]
MVELLKENWIFSIVSALVLGALGSGLWDIAFKPLFKKLGDVLFSVLTLGISKAKDSVYLEAAKGNKEQGGMYVARHLAGIMSGFLIASCVLFLEAPQQVQESHDVAVSCQSVTDKKEMISCVRAINLEKIKTLESLMVVYVPLALFVAVILMYGSLWMGAVNRVVTDYNQYMIICRPYLSEEDFLYINKDYALMKNKKEFDLIMEKIKEVAEKNDIE